MEFEAIAAGCYLEALGVGGGEVWFSDVVGGGIRRLSPDGRIDTWRGDTLWLAGIQFNDGGHAPVAGLPIEPTQYNLPAASVR